MSTSAAAPASTAAARGAFARSRLASALGVLPLGVWSVNHLWHNLAAFQGPEAWQAAVTEYPHPVAQALTGIVVLLPLAIHTVWGVGRVLTMRPNNARYRFYGNLKFMLQRLAGLGLLLFLGAHLWLAMIKPRSQTGQAEAFADLAHEMHFHGPTLGVYVLGVLALAYHLANGAHTFCMGWGIVSSQRGLRRLEWAALTFLALLLLMGWGAVYAIWAAGAPPPA